MSQYLIDVPDWETTTLYSINEVLETLGRLEQDIWITRGQSCCWGKLYPKIDRKPFYAIKDREKKLALEAKSIHLIQSIGMPVASPDERIELKHDMNTLMVLQHYGVPTRLLDWSRSPYRATFFSVYENPNSDCELWGFSYKKYIERGDEHWKEYPEDPNHTTIEVRYAMAFDKKVPEPDFFICVFDYLSHHRIEAQKGLFSMTARFGVDHSKAISRLFDRENKWYHRYIIKSDVKRELQELLKRDYKIELASLFPDMAGATEAVKAYQLKNLESIKSSKN